MLITNELQAGEQPKAPTFLNRVLLDGETGDTYVAGGIDIDLPSLVPNLLLASVIGAFGDIDFANGWYPIYVRSTGKVKIIVVATGAELAPTTDISGLYVEMFLFSE